MMALTTKELESYSDLFIQRRDAFAQQSPRGAYFLRSQPVLPEIVRAHLEGCITAGWYALDQANTSRWVCLDADRTDGLAQLQEAWKSLNERGIAAALERSRRGGHLWIFFEPIRSAVARRLVLGVLPNLEGVEVFPKQDRIAESGYGSLVRGPLGIHRLTGERYPFADPINLAPITTTTGSALEYLTGMPRLTAAEVAGQLALLLDEARRPAPRPVLVASQPQRAQGHLSPQQIKDRIGDLRSFVSRFVELDDLGRGACPFHPPDRNSSFSVHANGYWVCFHEVNPRTGRYLGGDAISFYMRLKGLTFREALGELQRQEGPHTKSPSQLPPEHHHGRNRDG